MNARYWLAVAIDRAAGSRFPWATLVINVSGAFVPGFLATLMARLQPHHPLRLLALVGFLGGYTTFSTFTLESHKLWERGAIGPIARLYGRQRRGRVRGGYTSGSCSAASRAGRGRILSDRPGRKPCGGGRRGGAWTLAEVD